MTHTRPSRIEPKVALSPSRIVHLGYIYESCAVAMDRSCFLPSSYQIGSWALQTESVQGTGRWEVSSVVWQSSVTVDYAIRRSVVVDKRQLRAHDVSLIVLFWICGDMKRKLLADSVRFGANQPNNVASPMCALSVLHAPADFRPQWKADFALLAWKSNTVYKGCHIKLICLDYIFGSSWYALTISLIQVDMPWLYLWFFEPTRTLVRTNEGFSSVQFFYLLSENCQHWIKSKYQFKSGSQKDKELLFNACHFTAWVPGMDYIPGRGSSPMLQTGSCYSQS